MLDRADYADFGCHNSIRLKAEHFLNTLALTFISFSGHFVFAVQKHYLFFFASDPLILFDTNTNIFLLCVYIFFPFCLNRWSQVIVSKMSKPKFKIKKVCISSGESQHFIFLIEFL